MIINISPKSKSQKKRIEQVAFKPIVTASERLFSETGKILEAGRQLMNPELLDSVFFCGCLFLQLDWIFFI